MVDMPSTVQRFSFAFVFLIIVMLDVTVVDEIEMKF